ncbi:cyclase-like protein 3 [Coffea eugenioides]|uniref:cyclase-like protein 3 n=1 Tax=Coffea eugenioides TaxID=49369 RepID=UPI000F606DB6|nr:cyclase-like protein 3 [Coffea eugenioides]
MRNGMATFGSVTGARNLTTEICGGPYMDGILNIGTHYGTHVDSPSHIFPEQLLHQVTVDSLNLSTLVGPVLVVQTPNGVNITGHVIDSLKIPRGVKRVIFKTQNTYRKLMDQQKFEGNFTGFTVGGAQRLVHKTDVTFVGIDYMSVAVEDQIVGVHKIFLGASRGIIPVENLKLDEVEPGCYTVYCLPLRVLAEAGPARCILVK